MVKIINLIFSILKYILLSLSFVITFYIVINMYKRLGKSFIDSLDIFILYIMLFILFIVNIIFDHKQITNNIFYNITCCLVFISLIFVGYRALYDNYLLLGIRNDYKINFSFYSDILAPLKSMLYLLISSNIILMFTKEKEKKIAIKDLK